MNIIFLDMDGVLCTLGAQVANEKKGLWRVLNPISTKLVARLAKDADAKVVLSSTWRLFYDRSAMSMILCNAGFISVPWHQQWKTPEAADGHRGHDIKLWFENGKADRYVILDDDTDFLPEQMESFVKTDECDGFGYHDYQKARKILGLSDATGE